MIDAKALEAYILQHTTEESPIRREVDRAAHVRLIRPRMLSGHLQGNLLKMMVQMLGAKYVLEIGTYSGYAAHCMAEGLPSGGMVHTIEADDEMEAFIKHYIKKSPHPEKINLHIGDALEIMPNLLQSYDFDLVYMDANKRQYPEYYEILMRHLKSGAVILADNTLWDGKVLQEVKESDVQTLRILEFNQMVQDDERVDNLILPLRDGLSMIRVR